MLKFFASLIFGIIICSIYYTVSSSLKHIYLGFKNNYTSDNKYLAVITENGLWLKDEIDDSILIVNASSIDNYYLNYVYLCFYNTL